MPKGCQHPRRRGTSLRVRSKIFLLLSEIGQSTSGKRRGRTSPAHSHADILMTAAKLQRLPEKPKTGAKNSYTSLDRMHGDLIDYLQQSGLGFPNDLCDSEGMYIIRSLARALWAIDGHHETLQNASKHMY